MAIYHCSTKKQLTEVRGELRLHHLHIVQGKTQG